PPGRPCCFEGSGGTIRLGGGRTMPVAAAQSAPGEGPEPSTQRPCCICCGEDSWAERFRVLRRCTACGFLRADLGLGEEDVKRLYQEDYFRGGKEYGDYLAEHASHRKNFAHRWRLVTRTAGA